MYRQRFFVILITIIMMMTSVAYADEISFYYEYDIEEKTYPEGALKIDVHDEEDEKEQIIALKSTEIPDFETYIKSNLRNHIAEIDVSMFNMRVGNFIAKVSEYSDELMIATGLVDCDAEKIDESKPEIDGIITKWRPIYLFSTKEKDIEARAFVKQEVQKYADEVRALTDDPLGQLLLVHDMLIENCEYDMDCVDDIETNDNIESYSAYGFFKNDIAVCQGYSEALYLIAKELGINIGFCVSFAKGHIWNYAEIDNEFYQLDITWNDPVIKRQYFKVDENGNLELDETGKPILIREEIIHRSTAIHEYFLCSDATMEKSHGEKETWYQSMDEKPDCADKFEGGYLFNILDPFTTKFVNREYVMNTRIVRNNGEVVFNETFKTDNLYVGPAIASVITENDTVCHTLYYVTELISGFDLYIGQYAGDKLLYGEKKGTSSDSFGRGSVISVGQTKANLVPGYDNFRIFMWGKDSMEPLAIPVSYVPALAEDI